MHHSRSLSAAIVVQQLCSKGELLARAPLLMNLDHSRSLDAELGEPQARADDQCQPEWTAEDEEPV
ncbi:MAG: hypothetical protein V3V08_25510 [Nannocystaceae bacterium]